MSAPAFPATERTALRRRPERGRYDVATVHAILDEALSCHVGFVVDGQPAVIPTIHVRVGDRLYLHGSPANRMLRNLAAGVPACVTVTLVDGLVLARSAFHTSMNYRSVVVLGRAQEVTDAAEKLRALEALVEHVVPGRSRDVRGPSTLELARTLVLRVPLEEVSAKVRVGGPLDDEADYALPVWAGEIPLRLTAQSPVADERVPPQSEVPDYALRYRRPEAGPPDAGPPEAERHEAGRG